MKKLLLFIFGLSLALSLKSQQLAKYNLYHYNYSYMNPAAVAASKCKEFNLTDKHQWLGIKGAPSIQALSAQIPSQFHRSKKHGLGLNIVRDKNGAAQTLSSEFIYSYQIEMGRVRKSFLSFGLSGNVGQHSFNETDFTEAVSDPIITGGIESELTFNASSGIYMYNNNYCAGIAVYNLLPVNSTYNLDYGAEQFFVTGIFGYKIKPSKERYFIRSSVYACRGENFIQVDLNNNLYMDNNFWLGLTLRKSQGSYYTSGQNAIIFLGFIKDEFDFSYAYDLGINSLQRNHYGSHQFNIAYKICRGKYACPTYK